MKDVLLYACWLSGIFFVLRLLTIKTKKDKIKEVGIETCIVFISCFICEFLSKRIGYKGIGTCVLGNKTTLVFTDNAGF
jgi:hypothetical protein